MVMHPDAAHSAIRIIGDQESTVVPYAKSRVPIGTGFILHVPGESLPLHHGYLITAAHVLEGQSNIEMQPTKMDGTLYNPPIAVGGWRVPDPNLDLAVAPLRESSPDKAPYWANPLSRAIPTGFIQSVEPGDPILYVGVLTPLDRNMVRSGTIGAVDQTGVQHVGGYEYPCHLVDCRSYGGFSGSPCFLYKPFPILEPSLWPLPQDEFPQPPHPMGATAHVILLAGMFTEHLTDKPGTDSMASRYGVGVMLRSQDIRTVLMSNEMRDERKKWEDDVEL